MLHIAGSLLEKSVTDMEHFQNKKVIFVFSRLELGGAERQGFLLAQHLKNYYDADVQVVGLQGKPGRLEALCKASGIPCRSLQLGLMRTRWECLQALLSFALQIGKEHPDLLVSYTRNANIYSALVWRLIGARGFIWNQADEGLGLGREPISRLAVSLTPCLISNSSGGRSFLQECYGIPDQRLSVIHNGIELAPPVLSRQEWRERNGLLDSEFVVCKVANISRFKDHATLLKAWKQVLTLAFPHRPVLLLAGRFDIPEIELSKLSDELQLGDRIRFLGGVDDVSGLLGSVDLFVYSSKSEGLPNAVVEAMAAGLPVVGSDIPGIREALGSTGTTFLAMPGDSAGLARKILQLMFDPVLCKSYGKELQIRAVAEFSLPMMLERSVSCLASVMKCQAGVN